MSRMSPGAWRGLFLFRKGTQHAKHRHTYRTNRRSIRSLLRNEQDRQERRNTRNRTGMFGRHWHAVLSGLIVASITLTGANTASALSSLEALKHPQNAWILTELATNSSVPRNLVTETSADGSLTVSRTLDNASQPTTAPRSIPTGVSTSTSPNIRARKPSRLGLILETGAALLSMGGFDFRPGDDAIEFTETMPLPAPQGYDKWAPVNLNGGQVSTSRPTNEMIARIDNLTPTRSNDSITMNLTVTRIITFTGAGYTPRSWIPNVKFALWCLRPDNQFSIVGGNGGFFTSDLPGAQNTATASKTETCPAGQPLVFITVDYGPINNGTEHRTLYYPANDPGLGWQTNNVTDQRAFVYPYRRAADNALVLPYLAGRTDPANNTAIPTSSITYTYQCVGGTLRGPVTATLGTNATINTLVSAINTCPGAVTSFEGSVTPSNTVIRWNANIAPGAITVPVTTKVTCRKADGTELIVEQSATVDASQPFTPPAATCPAEFIATKGSVEANVNGTVQNLIPETNANPELVAAPECWNGGCVPELYYNANPDTTTTPNYQRCDGSSWRSCLGWQSNPNKQNQFQCRTGTKTVALDKCNSQSWDPNTGNPTIGLPAPTPTPSTDVPVDSENCFADAVSYNPINWVYIPVKCVMQWAFVPSDGALESWRTDAQSITSKPPLSFLATSIAWFNSMRDTSACITADTCTEQQLMMTDGRFFSIGIYDGLRDQVQAGWYTPIRTILNFAIWTAVVWWSINRIAASFGGKTSGVAE